MLRTTALTDSQVSVIRSLAQLNIDSRDGFQFGAEKLDPRMIDLRRYFNTVADQRGLAAKRLNELIVDNAESKVEEGSFVASFHRTIMSVRDALSSATDEFAILSEAERGEDAILDAYRDAVDEDLPSDVLQLLNDQKQEVQRSHDQVKSMRDNAKA